MANAQNGSSTETEEACTFLWIIPNHDFVVSKHYWLGSANRLMSFTSRSGTEYNFQVGYSMVDKKNFAPYLKMLNPNVQDFHPYIKWSLSLASQPLTQDTILQEMRLPGYIFSNKSVSREIFSNALVMPLKGSLLPDAQGCVTWKVGITIFENSSPKPVPNFEYFFTSNLKSNMSQLLLDTNSSDLKIACSDGVELTAHKLILSSQNPVFAAMLNANMTEKSTGSVKIEDVSSTTMKVLLSLLYTGELGNDWREPETIVEFTYAAGKYQLTEVLEMLDDLLGTFDHGDNNLQLLNLSTKLSLKKAETRLLPCVKESVSKATTSSDLFKMLEI